MINHVYPVDDLREHVVDTKEGVCWCNPEVEYIEGEEIYIHNAMDGREQYETGVRKPT